MRLIIGKMIEADKLFGMFSNHDKIAIGISGGKDSLVLWKALDIYVNKLKQQLNWDISIIAIHVKMNYYDNIDYSKLDLYVNDNNLSLTYIDSDIGSALKAKTKNDKVQCSLCSKMKKAVLVNTAVKSGCNKIAMGHHADDAIETLWLNMINEARIATFKPITYLDRNKIYLIRPMILCREKDIIKQARKACLPIITNMCPNEHSTQRAYIKTFLQIHFYDNPAWNASYQNFLIALLNGKTSSLWFYNDDKLLDLYKTGNKKIKLS